VVLSHVLRVRDCASLWRKLPWPVIGSGIGLQERLTFARGRSALDSWMRRFTKSLPLPAGRGGIAVMARLKNVGGRFIQFARISPDLRRHVVPRNSPKSNKSHSALYLNYGIAARYIATPAPILFGPNYAATLHSRSGDDLFFFFLKLVLRHAPILRILLWYWRFSNTVAITARCQSQRGEEVHCGSRTSRG